MTINRYLCAFILMCLSPFASADDDDIKKLTEYFQNFGSYIGFDVTETPTVTPPVNALLNEQQEQNLLNNLLISFFNALPVTSDTTQPNFSLFVPNNSPNATLNKSANNVFSAYNTVSKSGDQTSSQGSAVTANQLIDQLTSQGYQSDPVNQAVTNIISTPESTIDTSCNTCIPSSGTPCNPLCQNVIVNNVIGTLPTASQFYSASCNAQIADQLNADVLIAPLLYSTEQTSSTAASTDTDACPKTPGMQAQSQANLADNFIRYATKSVAPLALPSYTTYNTAYSASLETDSTGALTTNAISQQAIIYNYLASLRVYAAQSSVAISNLYSILARRLPQQPSGSAGQNPATSAALTEFEMATRRINTPSSSSQTQNTQWIEQINTASPATVQKEIAILLAEINYQLYLSRQQQERILLTNTLLVLEARVAPDTTAISGGNAGSE